MRDMKIQHGGHYKALVRDMKIQRGGHYKALVRDMKIQRGGHYKALVRDMKIQRGGHYKALVRDMKIQRGGHYKALVRDLKIQRGGHYKALVRDMRRRKHVSMSTLSAADSGGDIPRSDYRDWSQRQHQQPTFNSFTRDSGRSSSSSDSQPLPSFSFSLRDIPPFPATPSFRTPLFSLRAFIFGSKPFWLLPVEGAVSRVLSVELVEPQRRR